MVPKYNNLGTVQHFYSSGLQKCCTVPKFLYLGTKNLGTVQHFCSSGLQKCCTVPNFFGFSLKSAVLSLKKPKKPILQNLQAGEALKVLENRFFRFFRDSTALFSPRPKKLGTVQHFCSSGLQKCCTVPKFLVPKHNNLGTVQHFYSSGLQKCCTVPKFLYLGTTNLGTVQHFCSSGLQKCCTVPKFLCLGTKNLGTVQHFCSSGLQKCCTVPNFFGFSFGFSLKSAVLSLKNLKNLFSRTFRLGRP